MFPSFQCLSLYSDIKLTTLLKLCPYISVFPTGLWVPLGPGTESIGLCVPKTFQSASVTH